MGAVLIGSRISSKEMSIAPVFPGDSRKRGSLGKNLAIESSAKTRRAAVQALRTLGPWDQDLTRYSKRIIRLATPLFEPRLGQQDSAADSMAFRDAGTPGKTQVSPVVQQTPGIKEDALEARARLGGGVFARYFRDWQTLEEQQRVRTVLRGRTSTELLGGRIRYSKSILGVI